MTIFHLRDMRLKERLRLETIPQDCHFGLLLYGKTMKGLGTRGCCEVPAETTAFALCPWGSGFRAMEFHTHMSSASQRLSQKSLLWGCKQ